MCNIGITDYRISVKFELNILSVIGKIREFLKDAAADQENNNEEDQAAEHYHHYYEELVIIGIHLNSPLLILTSCSICNLQSR